MVKADRCAIFDGGMVQLGLLKSGTVTLMHVQNHSGLLELAGVLYRPGTETDEDICYG